MNVTEQAEALTKAWTEAQRQVWGGWMNMAQSAASGQGGLGGLGGLGGMGAPSFDPMAMMRQGMEAWTSAFGSTPTGKLAGDMFNSQSSMLKVMDLVVKSWGVVAPNLQSGTPWQPDFQKLFDGWMQQFGSAQERTQGMMEGMQLLAQAPQNWMQVMAPFAGYVGQAFDTGHMEKLLGTGGFMDALQGSPFLNQFMLFGKSAENAISGLSELPAAGIAREKNAKLFRAMDALSDVRKATIKYDLAMAKGLRVAVERLMEALAGKAEKGEQITSLRELMKLWFQIADKTLTEEFTSSDFVVVQDEMTDAMMSFKLRQRELVEMFLTQMDMPTRTEVDDAFRTIHDLKKQVRQLKKQMKAISDQPAVAEATPAPARKAAPRKAAAKEAAPKEEPAAG